MQTIEALLREVPLFSSLEPVEIAYLAERCQIIDLEPNVIFLHEDELGDSMYVIAHGSVDIIKALGTQEESLLAIYQEGELVGEMSLLNPLQPRSASARSRDNVTLLVVTREAIEQLLPRFPRVAIDFLRIMSERLYATASVKIRDLVVKNQELNQAYADLQAAQERLIQQEVLEQELRHAQRIQQQMLPTVLPKFAHVDIGARMIPARMVGGDLYDVIQLDDERLAVVVGDVAGKGIPASLYMALVCSLLRATASTTTMPTDVLRVVNEHLCDRDMDSMFVTLIYGVLNIHSGEFTYVLGGHDRPYIWHGTDGSATEKTARSRPLGLLHETLLQSSSAHLTRGSYVLLFSDGVTEAMNQAGEQFGPERLLNEVIGRNDLSAQALCDHVVAAVERHQGEAPQSDDMTVLALRMT